MKVQQQFPTWDHETSTTPSTTFCCKRLRSLAPKLGDAATTPSLRSFIRPETKSNSKNVGGSGGDEKLGQVETQSGGTRWNPTQEQIGILEMLYGGGMRTPNATQIEHITLQLAKFGKIEGKNVFYWFQNHKARERQKQKRISLCLKNPTLSPNWGESEEEDSYLKRKQKCRSWAVQNLEVESTVCGSACEDKTLELFPLHPEGR